MLFFTEQGIFFTFTTIHGRMNAENEPSCLHGRGISYDTKKDGVHKDSVFFCFL